MVIPFQQQNMVISLIQEHKAQDVTIFDDIDATSFGFQEFPKCFDRDNITVFPSRYTK